MDQRYSNQLNMIGACLSVAHSREHINVWQDQPPVDFTTDMVKLQTDYDAVTLRAAQADEADNGVGGVKAVAETTLEDAVFILARALANHYKKTGDLDKLGVVDVSKADIVKLRVQDLVNKATTIRNLGNAASRDPNAASRGVTGARIAALTAAIATFSGAMSNLRSQTIDRSTLLREVETDIAGLVALVTDMDDLVIQFDGTDAGLRFIEAWKVARTIVDSGDCNTTSPTA